MGACLHLIKPLGFSLDEKAVRRSGLDYWHSLDLKVWENLDEFFVKNPINNRHFFATTKTKTPYFDMQFLRGDYFYFGSEGAGLPLKLLKNQTINIPMKKEFRSLNLSNAVSIVLYEALRQNFAHFSPN